jgi:hypothetical protein
MKNKSSKKYNKNTKLIVFIFTFSVFFIMLLPKLFIPSVETVKDSVVLITIYDNEGKIIGTGSGFSAYRKNWIITNLHVIEGAYSITVTTDDKQELDVTNIVLFNKENDLAIVEINGDLKNLSLGNGTNLKVKSDITTIGSPKGEQNIVSEGIISNIDDKKLITISAPISHGSSGGVLLDSNNQVIGITNAGYVDAQNLNFAINVEILKDMYFDYIEGKYHEINQDNYKDCTPDIFNYNTMNELEMRSQCTNSDYENFVVKNIYDFYMTTNSYEIFNTVMYKLDGFNGFYNNYKKLSKDDQKLVAQYYQALIKYENCDTNQFAGCSIDNASSWNSEQLVMELDVLQTYALSIFLVEIKYQNSQTYFNYINSLPITAANKGILALLYCNYTPKRLGYNNALKVVEYINSLQISGTDKKSIYMQLGYTIDGTTVRW